MSDGNNASWCFNGVLKEPKFKTVKSKSGIPVLYCQLTIDCLAEDVAIDELKEVVGSKVNSTIVSQSDQLRLFEVFEHEHEAPVAVAVSAEWTPL